MTGSPWDQLLAVALVGTARRPVPVAAAGGLVDVEEKEPEAALLGAAAVLATYRRAGTVALAGGPPPEPAPVDDRPEPPAAAVHVLELLLDGEVRLSGGRTPLAAEWLQRCAGGGRRLPAHLLPPVLDLAGRNDELRSAALAAAGPRATWLAARNPAWRWAAPPVTDPEEIDRRWATAPRPERLRLLATLRAAEPAAARALVESTWSTEPAADRAAFVEVLSTDPTDADEPFLEAALDDRAATVRRAAAAALDGLPRSRRAARMAARLEPLIQVTRRVRKHLEVAHPDDLDAAARRDGITDDRPAGMGLRAWWLIQLVGGAPLEVWTRCTGLSPDEVVRLGAGAAELLLGWERAVARRRDVDWAEALVAHRPTPAVLAALPPARAWPAVSGVLSGTATNDVVAPLLAACPGPWPEVLGLQVIERCRRKKGSLPLVPLVPTLATRLDPAAVPVLEAWADSLPRTSTERAEVRGLVHTLTLRQSIARELP